MLRTVGRRTAAGSRGLKWVHQRHCWRCEQLLLTTQQQQHQQFYLRARHTQLRRAWRSSYSRSFSSSAVPTKQEDDANHLPSTLIDFQVSSKIEGEESHVALVDLRPGETLRAESGAMVFMTEGIVMDTKLNGASSAFSRMLTGQNLFLTDFRYEGTEGKGTVGLGTDFPSKILRFSLDEYPDSTLICQKGAYMASNHVNIEMEFTKSLTAGFFGGEGFVLQKLSGLGDVLVKGGGTIVNKILREGETLRVTSGSIVAFENSISYDVQMMPGIRNAMFGGEGLFVTSLTGPGQVWLQGMPPDRMIAEVARRVPGGGGIGLGVPLGIGGGGSGEEGGEVAGAADEAAAAGAAGAGEAAGGAGEGGEGMVASTDAAVEADRNATIASSGMASSSSSNVDADSPSALFGDAAPPEATAAAAKPDSDTSTYATETTFSDDSSFSSEPSASESSFNDGDFSTDEFSEGGDYKDGELFDDTGSSSSVTEGGGDDEGVSSIFSTLWDIFSGGGDE